MYYAEEFPHLDVRDLRRHGALGDESRPDPFCVKFSDVTISVTKNPDALYIIAVCYYEDRTSKHILRLHYSRNTFGRRAYFSCPATGKRCATLFLVRDRFVSRLGAGLPSALKSQKDHVGGYARRERLIAEIEGLDLKPKARGNRRLRLLERLAAASEGSIAHEDRWRQAVASERRLRRRRVVRSNQSKNALSTAAAIACATWLVPDDLAGEALARSQLSIARLPDAAPSPSRPLQILEATPALDIRALNKELDLSQGKFFHLWLSWPQEPEPAGLYLLAVDLTDPSEPMMAISGFTAAGELLQKIELVGGSPRAPARWFMVCPVTGRRSDILFLRDNLFASAKAQRLVHQSQRAAGPD